MKEGGGERERVENKRRKKREDGWGGEWRKREAEEKKNKVEKWE